jgi:hypothetical protein
MAKIRMKGMSNMKSSNLTYSIYENVY